MDKSNIRYNEVYVCPEDKEAIKRLYLSGLSTIEVGEQFNITRKKVAKILDEFGVERRKNGSRKYNVNEHYFDKIDNQNKAYILGLLYADGCNYKKKQTISLSLEEKDKDILEKIRIEIGSDKPLEYLDYSNKHDFGYTYKNQYRLLVFSKYMCNILEKHGVIPNKSLLLDFPNIPKSLINSFVRGYFDGDGSISRGKNVNTNFNLTITSTNDFCVKLKEIVEEILMIHCGISDASNHNGITKVFTISGRIQVKKFMDWLYEDADMFLERKFQRYLDYFYNITEENNSLIV